MSRHELPTSPDLPALEREVARWWQERGVPERSAAHGAGGPRWTCYAAPAVAAGVPGLHHVADRVLADVLPRFRVMGGYQVARAGGWDCHGLPAEVAVERELGLRGPADIEAYGIGAFVARCREFAARHAAAQARLAGRAGCGAGLAGARSTMEPAYVESVWWSLRVLFDRGLLVSDVQVSPCCPRCATPLSDREAARPEAQRAVREPTVTVRFPLRGPLPGVLRGASLLAVAPAPWTLAANAALLAAPDAVYAVARRSGQGDRVVVADAVLGRVLGEGWHVVRRLAGSELAGLSYEPPLPLPALPGPHRVIAAPLPEGLTGLAGSGWHSEPESSERSGDGGGVRGSGRSGRLESFGGFGGFGSFGGLGGLGGFGGGTGLACVAPPFGAADLALARAHGLPVADLAGADGTFAAGLPVVGGLPVADAGKRLISDLADRGLVHASAWRELPRPHCWRCGAPLLPRAVRAWRVPAEDGSWTVSRTRYWGTPLPVWTCAAGHATCAGSLAELSALAVRDLTGLDPHRPHVDKVVIGCPRCGEPARRVPDVLDAAYDAAALPFALLGAPHQASAATPDYAPADYPADLACASGDRAGDWLNAAGLARDRAPDHAQGPYSGRGQTGRPASPDPAGQRAGPAPVLGPGGPAPACESARPAVADQPAGPAVVGYPADLACASGDRAPDWLDAASLLGRLVLGRAPYLRAARSDPLPDGQGRAVSAQVGNVQEPLAVLDTYGADAVRWLFAAGAAPPGPPGAALAEIVQRVVAPYWAAARVLEGAGAAGGPPAAALPAAGRPALDRWLLSELNVLVREVTAALEAPDTTAACRLLSTFLDDQAGWYLRRFRQRESWPGPAAGRASGVAALRVCVRTLSRLLAPFMPFVTDYVWAALGQSPDSVHLAAWPACDASLIDPQLAGQVAQARRLADAGRAARCAAGVPEGRPLPRALAGAGILARLPAELHADVLVELNIATLEPAADLPAPGPRWAVAAAGGVAIALELAPSPPRAATAAQGQDAAP